MIIANFTNAINEYSMSYLYSLSNSSIPQRRGYKHTRSRSEIRNNSYSYPSRSTPKISKNGNAVYDRYGRVIYTATYSEGHMDMDYSVEYVRNSYYHSGIFRFIIRTEANPRGGSSEYEMMIKPRVAPNSYNDLISNVNVEIFCSCNDFRFTFMNLAYKAIHKLSKFGIFPIRDRIINSDEFAYSYTKYNIQTGNTEHHNIDAWNHSSLPRYRFIQDTGREDAPTKNPQQRGALCKHLIMLFDGLLDSSFGDSDLINEEIIKRKGENVEYHHSYQSQKGQYYGEYDINDRPNTKNRIIEIRENKVRDVLSITAFLHASLIS